MYDAALAGETWKAIAGAHGYETPSGAYAAARTYAERQNLDLPPGPRTAQGRERRVRWGADTDAGTEQRQTAKNDPAPS